MENMMKRAISAIMALVLVLGMMPGVPMFAGAEEVETQPETMAVETTEAAALPEETEAAETAAGTVAEETAAAETEPAETVPQETLPEEAAAEETVSEETAPVETIPDVAEEAADAGDVIVVPTKITVSAAKERTYVGDDVKLSASFEPAGVSEAQVDWTVDGGEYLLAKDTLRGLEAGVYTVTGSVTFQDKEGQEKIITSEPVEVEFVNYWVELNTKPIPDENKTDDAPWYILQSGASLTLGVKYMSQGVNDEEAKVEKVGALAEPELTWTMTVMEPANKEGIDEETGYATELVETDRNAALYITRKDGSDPRESVFTANLVTEYQYIRLTATDRIAGTTEQECIICLYPNSYKLYITDENGADITNGTITLDAADPEVALTQLLHAKIWPYQGDEELVWSVSDTLVKLEHELEDEKDTEYDNWMNFTADKREGESVITVKGISNPDLKATVTVKRVRLTQAIDWSSESAKVTELMAGKSVTLKVVEDTEARDFMDNKLLKWELAEGDEAYATLSASGVLKAKNVAEGRVVTVRCSILGNEKAEAIEKLVIIRPKAVSVDILAGPFAEGGEARSLDWEEVINGKTITVDTKDYAPTNLAFRVNNYVEEAGYPGAPVGAKQEVTWKSSNTSIAAIDPLTDAVVWKGKNGTVTITATAADGSGRSASVKLTFGTKLDSLSIIHAADYLRSGESWTFGVSCLPENATNKAVTWAVYDEEGQKTTAASISANGKLTAKTVYDNQTVLVVATSKENPEISAEYEVVIRPKKPNTLTILDENGACVTKQTIQLDVGESVSLSALQVGETVGDYFDPGAEWKTSNAKVAAVEDGYVEALKTGSATITAKIDGQTATVTIKVVSRVDEIEIYEKNDIHVLASGKSLSLKATVMDYETATEKNPNGKPTVSKVAWHIPEEYAHLATVNASGKVTAVKGYTGPETSIVVYAMSTDGGEVPSNDYEIVIYPAVEAMRIDLQVGEKTVSGSYTYYMLEPGETLQLNAVTHPENACDDVTWTTSGKTVATVDEDGKVTVLKAGSVTITATSMDGTGKKATFKIKILRKAANRLYFENAKNVVYDETMGCNVFAIAGGKNLTIKPVLYDTDWKKVSVTFGWDMELITPAYGTAFVKSFSKGVVKTAAVTETKYAKVTVKVPVDYVGWDYNEDTLDEEGYVHCDIVVAIYPATTSLEITDAEGQVITGDLWNTVGGADIELGVATNAGAAQGWTWKSSNEKLATVDENGVVSYNPEYEKYGYVTITATAKDGSGKSDSVKIYYAK